MEPDIGILEHELLTGHTPRERLSAYVNLLSRVPGYPAGSANGSHVQAVVLRDIAAFVLQGVPLYQVIVDDSQE